MNIIGENLKKLRKAHGLSYRRLGNQVGISHTNISAYEKGEISPSIENVIAICKFFKVPIEYLILGDKAEFKYKDIELLELFGQADDLEDELKKMVKNYIRRILTLKNEKEKLKKELK